MSASKITGTVTLPDQDMFGFRKLSAKHLRRAIEAQMFAQAEFMERIKAARDRIVAAHGGEKTPDKPAESEKPSPDAPVAPVVVDPLAPYDRHTLVRLGLLTVNGATLDAEAADAWVDDLSVEDLQEAATAVLMITDKSAFLTPDEREAERKNA